MDKPPIDIHTCTNCGKSAKTLFAPIKRWDDEVNSPPMVCADCTEDFRRYDKVETEQPPIDIHTHLLNYEITPEKVYFGGREWDLKKLSPILHAYCNSDPIDDVVEWIYNLFTKKDIDSDPIAKVFFTPLSEQWKLFAEMPCTPNVMTIDFRGSSGTDEEYVDAYVAQRTIWLALDDVFITIGKAPSTKYAGITMENGSAMKAYPAMWNGKGGHEMFCNMSQRIKRPIIAHASQGGIGRNKANNNPLKWWDALMEYPESVICFAHAIGYSDEEWEVIERMALEFRFLDGRPRIYVDTAFVEGFKFDPDTYYNRLRTRLDGNCADGIMWGTDWPLCTIYYSQQESIDSHKKHLGAEKWEIISRENPSRFLGVK